MGLNLGFIGKKLHEYGGDIGRAIGTAADAVIPGNQSNWHQPAAPAPVAPPPITAPRPVMAPSAFAPKPIFNPVLGAARTITAPVPVTAPKPVVSINPLPTAPRLPIVAPKINMPVEIGKQFVGGVMHDAPILAKNIAQGIARTPETVLRSVAQPGASAIDPSADTSQQGKNTGVRKFLYGEDPVKTYFQQGQDLGQLAHSKVSQIDPKYGILAAPVLAALDLAGGGKSHALTQGVAKATTENAVRTQLVKHMGADAAAALPDHVVTALAKEKDPTKVLTILKNPDKVAAPIPPPIPRPVVGMKTPLNPIEGVQHGGVRQTLKQGFSDADQVILDELRNIDSHYPVPKGSPTRVEKFMYNSNMQRGSNAVANQAIGHSAELQQAIGGLGKNEYKLFNEYANARTELASAKDGTPTSLPVPKLQAIVDSGKGTHYEERFNALNAHYKNLADQAHAGGLISDETHAKYKANNDYIRIQRDMGDLLPPPGQGRSYSLGSTILNQKRKGSTREILPAGETAAHYTQQITREIAKNRTGTHLVGSLHEAGLAQKLPGPASTKNTVSIMRNGVKETYEVSPAIKEAVSNINPYHMNIVMQILGAPGRLFRAGVTGLNPVFIARNLLKDQVGTAINTRHLLATHNPSSFIHGLMSATKDAAGGSNDPIYQDFLRHYGDTTSYDLTRNVKNTKDAVALVRGGKPVAFKQALKSPIRSLENIASITEKSTRFQNYRGEYKNAIAEGLAPDQASERAAIAAWQNSVDFSRAGTWGRALNTVIPYWNPATQGVRQMGRTLAHQPVKSALTGTALIGVPLAAATAWNLSSPDTAAIYNNIPEYEKDNNIILIPPGTTQNQDGTYDVVKVPLAPGWKDVFMPIRRAFEDFNKHKPLEFTKMAQDVLQATGGPVSFNSVGAFAGSFVPQAVKPLVQQYANKDLFSGKTIVPDYINQATDAQGNPIPEGQKADKFSSGTAKAIGGALHVSPIRVEKFVKDTGGTVGSILLNTADQAGAKVGLMPKDQVGGTSVAGGFKRSFGSANSIVNNNKSEGAKFFDKVKKVTAKFNVNEQAAYSSLHPATKNFLGDTITQLDTTYNPAARLDVYNRYPRIFEADKQLDALNRADGKPGNPLFDLKPDQVKKVLEKENLPPGAKDPELSTLYNKEWYSDYSANKTTYYDQIKKNLDSQLVKAKQSGDTKQVTTLTASVNKFNSPDNPYPTTSSTLQKTLDAYSALPKGTGDRSAWIRSNPTAWAAMKTQFAKVDNWQNIQRGKRGLAVTEGDQGAKNGYGTVSISAPGSSGYGGYRSGITSPYKYNVSLNAGKRRPRGAKAIVKVKLTKKGGAAPKTARRNVAKPKVSLRKSLV